MEIFQHVDVKTYNRTDAAGQRIGFLAQDIQQYLPPEFANVIGMQYGGDMPLLSLSYDRLVCVLWAVCKSQEQRISALDGRLTSLEAKKQKGATMKRTKNPTELPQQKRKVFLAPNKCTSKHWDRPFTPGYRRAYTLVRKQLSTQRWPRGCMRLGRPFFL